MYPQERQGDCRDSFFSLCSGLFSWMYNWIPLFFIIFMFLSMGSVGLRCCCDTRNAD